MSPGSAPASSPGSAARGLGAGAGAALRFRRRAAGGVALTVRETQVIRALRRAITLRFPFLTKVLVL